MVQRHRSRRFFVRRAPARLGGSTWMPLVESVAVGVFNGIRRKGGGAWSYGGTATSQSRIDPLRKAKRATREGRALRGGRGPSARPSFARSRCAGTRRSGALVPPY